MTVNHTIQQTAKRAHLSAIKGGAIVARDIERRANNLKASLKVVVQTGAAMDRVQAQKMFDALAKAAEELIRDTVRFQASASYKAMAVSMKASVPGAVTPPLEVPPEEQQGSTNYLGLVGGIAAIMFLATMTLRSSSGQADDVVRDAGIRQAEMAIDRLTGRARAVAKAQVLASSNRAIVAAVENTFQVPAARRVAVARLRRTPTVAPPVALPEFNIAIEQPKAYISKGEVVFEDGRHRFSVLRDMGFDTVPVTVHVDEAAEFRAKFGTHKSTTQRFAPHPSQRDNPETYTTILADVAKLDASWTKDTGFYIPRGGGGAEIAGRRAKFAEFLKKHTIPPRPLTTDDGKFLRVRFALPVSPGLERGQGGDTVLEPGLSGYRKGMPPVDPNPPRRTRAMPALIGWQIISMLDERVRPKHAERHGRKYYYDPAPGERGLEEMPNPPYESPKDGGVMAYNCRCVLVPIIEEM